MLCPVMVCRVVLCCAVLQVHFVDVCVKGIGQSTTRLLWERGWLNTPAGLYSVTKVSHRTPVVPSQAVYDMCSMHMCMWARAE